MFFGSIKKQHYLHINVSTPVQNVLQICSEYTSGKSANTKYAKHICDFWCFENLPLHLIVPVVLINNAQWLGYAEKTSCDALLPPISTQPVVQGLAQLVYKQEDVGLNPLIETTIIECTHDHTTRDSGLLILKDMWWVKVLRCHHFILCFFGIPKPLEIFYGNFLYSNLFPFCRDHSITCRTDNCVYILLLWSSSVLLQYVGSPFIPALAKGVTSLIK